jgi:ribosomal protein S18 acetylase RimI-like enzyme
LHSISSDGAADYIWTQLAEPGEHIVDVGERRYARENTAFSYQNCVVAEVDGSIEGMLVTFAIEVPDNPEKEADPVLASYSKLEEYDSWYICVVALFESFRGKGLGSQFMPIAEQQARDRQFKKLSLIVFEENAGVKRFYDALGYREVMREAIYPHPIIHCAGDAILMVKNLDD